MKEVVAAYFEAQFVAAEESGFSLLKRIPSSEAKRFLLGYADLSPSERALYRKAVGLRAAGPFDPHEQTPHTQLFIRFISTLPYPSWIHSADSEKAKAPQLRKQAKLTFQQLLNAKPEQDFHEPGEWLYTGKLNDREITVRIRYNRRLYQMAYSVNTGENPERRMNYESFLGFGIAHWDLISVHEIDAAFNVLTEVTTETLRLYDTSTRLVG